MIHLEVKVKKEAHNSGLPLVYTAEYSCLFTSKYVGVILG